MSVEPTKPPSAACSVNAELTITFIAGRIYSALIRRQTEVYRHLVHDLLPKEHVYMRDLKMLTPEQKNYINELFEETIFPVLTPVAVDAYRPFPTLLGRTLNLLVMLENNGSDNENMDKVAE